MKHKRTTQVPPAFRKGAELIVKANPGLDVSRKNPHLIVTAGIYLLGNRDGFRWLSDYFAWRADQIDEDRPFYKEDADDHDHLACSAPLNLKLSDDFDVQFGSFSNKLRRRLLKAYKINRRRRASGELVIMFRSTLRFLKTLSKDDRARRSESWPRAITALRQLIGEAGETVAELEAATKKPATGDTARPRTVRAASTVSSRPNSLLNYLFSANPSCKKPNEFARMFSKYDYFNRLLSGRPPDS